MTKPKLVRDRIPEIIAASGGRCAVKTLTEADYRVALRQKLLEEAQEAAAAPDPDALVAELADLQEVIDTLLTAYGIAPATLRQRQQEKRTARGGFAQRLQLLWRQKC